MNIKSKSYLKRVNLIAVAMLASAVPLSAAVTTTFDTVTGAVSIITDAADSVILTVSAGEVKINGTDPLVIGVPTPVSAASVVSISYLGNIEVETVDLSSLLKANFPLVTTVTLTTAGGNDLITGGELDESIIPGPGTDTVVAGGGNDTITWNGGDGTDDVNGGLGIDIQIVNGASAGTGDVFTLAASGTDALFQRTNFGNFSVTTRELETFQVNSLADDDTFTVGSLAGTTVTGVTFTGGTGVDTLDGTATATPLTAIWNGGDGSDVAIGGTGLDTQIVNGSSAGTGDVFTLAASGTDALFQRTNFGNFSVTTRALETFQVNSLADDDTITVGSLTGTGVTGVTFTGGTGADTLDGTATATPLTTIWNGGDGSDVAIGGTGLDTQIVNGSSAGTGDVFTLAAVGTDALFQRTNFGNFSVTTRALETFQVNSLADADSFTVGSLAGTGVTGVTFTGGTGADILDGTATATPLRSIWNNGDNTDVIIGGSGLDVQVVNGASGGTGDIFTLAAVGPSAFFERTNLIPFSITTSALESFEVNSLADADSFNVGSLAGTTVTGVAFTGGTGADTLDGTATATPLRNIWNNGDGSDIATGGTGLDTQVVNGSTGTTGDVFTLAASGANAFFQRTNFGNFSVTTNAFESFSVNGLVGDESFTVGSLAGTSVTGVSFVGGPGADTFDASASSTPVTSTWNNGDGTDVFFGGTSTDTQIVNGSTGATGDVFTLNALGNQGFFQRTNFGTFSVTTTAVEGFQINGLAGSETVTVGNLAATTISSVSINGGNNDDAINVLSNATTALLIDGGSNDVTGDILTVDVHGASSSQTSSTVQVGSDQPITFSNIESVVITNAPSRVDDYQLFD